ncbi:hypothetical protein FGIG_07903 [Fasciola gigantica]|uniref:Uncharacterized protein n=1 Tax=Fasciola gigantica TaxID=46835 RepID=A0A504Z9N7_FASGI|nr:hypothetical protein FGIG_07903 [Fasciola gigantica]
MEDQERNSPDAPLPLIFDNKLRLPNQEEVTEMDGQLRYCDSEAVESKVTGTTRPVGWKSETAAQSPKHERGVQSPLYREFDFESNSRSSGRRQDFHSDYLTEEQNPRMSAVRLMREQKSQDYHSMTRLSAGPFCTPLSHSHDDLRRSRSQFAAATATTYPTLGSRPRFQDSHAYHVLERSLAPLVRGSTSQVSPHGGPVMLSNPRVRRVLGGSENRSTMSSCDQPGDILRSQGE